MKTFNPYPLRIDEELMEELKEMAPEFCSNLYYT